MTSPLKIPLQREKVKPNSWRPPGHETLNISFALPFYLGKPGCYVHRIRRGKTYLRDGKYSHTCFSFWCGGNGHLGKSHPQARIMAEAPEHEVFCATCEGRAIGAGFEQSHVINGRMVRFSPRK